MADCAWCHGEMSPRLERLGTCAVALGFDLPDHRSVKREIKNTPSWGLGRASG